MNLGINEFIFARIILLFLMNNNALDNWPVRKYSGKLEATYLQN